jgi:hypothetical protein
MAANPPNSMPTVKQLFQEDKSVFYKSIIFLMNDKNKLSSRDWVDSFFTDKIERGMLGEETRLLKKKLKMGLDNWNVHGFLLLYVSRCQDGNRYDLVREALESIPLV